jgi:hypothetical protein
MDICYICELVEDSLPNVPMERTSNLPEVRIAFE